ncbi:putative bifunctional diguanylate cyclase/phosphodiesterase [Thalassotalea fusca]
MTNLQPPNAHSLSYLLAEDSHIDAEIVKAMLANAYGTSCSVLHVETFEDIAKALDCATFEALILDLNLPDRSGIDNVPYLVHRYPTLPIVVLTSESDEHIAVNALKRGAQDYLNKQDVTSQSLARSLRYAKERKQIEMVLKDALSIAEQQNKRLQQCVHYDFLTGLANRPFFEQIALRAIRVCARNSKELALIFIDIKRFKHVNESCGISAGDSILVDMAKRIKHIVRDSDLVTRYTGDKFLLLIELKSNKEEVFGLINRIKRSVERPIAIGEKSIALTCSYGVSFYPEANTLELLTKQAEQALQKAKTNSTDAICFYKSHFGNGFERQNLIASKMHAAITNEEFEVLFQPVLDTQNNEYMDVEAFLRWNSSELNEIEPIEFIPIAEKKSCINELTKVVLNQAKKLIDAFNSNTFKLDSVKINITLNQLAKQGFGQLFLCWLEEYNIPPTKICLELTESKLGEMSAHSRFNIAHLRANNVNIAIDNFGTGSTSIKDLINLPVDIINIDKSLIHRIVDNKQHHTMTSSIIDMAHNLGIKVVAEGIETEQEFNMSQQLSCDGLQGYYLGRPQNIQCLIESEMFH